MSRFFQGPKRHAAIDAAGGRCENPRCMSPTEALEIDHIVNYANGGPTTQANAQVLCRNCHSKKLETDWGSLRKGQRLALEVVQRRFDGTLLIELHVGHGKTRVATEAFRLKSKFMPRGWFTVPGDQHRSDALDALIRAGIHAEIYDGQTKFTEEQQVYVATYAQVANNADRIDAINVRSERLGKGVLALCDEIHHAGEDRWWGDGVAKAFSSCAMRIVMSGTPFRHDGTDIALVGDNEAAVRWALVDEYRETTPCVEYASFPTVSCSVSDQLSPGDSPASLTEWEGAIGPIVSDLSSVDSWGTRSLGVACDHLDTCRATVCDAGGLLVANSIAAAERYTRMLTRLGKSASLVHGEMPSTEADAIIDGFRNGDEEWLVSVQKVSEGVDIPRIEVILYASAKTTDLHFIQVVGRGIRTRSGMQGRRTCRVIIPDHPVYRELAAKFEKTIPHEVRSAISRETETESRATGTQERLSSIITSDGTAVDEIRGDHAVPSDYVAELELRLDPAFRSNAGAIAPIAYNLAAGRLQRSAPEGATAVIAPARTPKPRTKIKTDKQLKRDRFNSYVKLIARKERREHGVIYGELYEQADVGIASLKEASEQQIERLIGLAERRLNRGGA